MASRISLESVHTACMRGEDVEELGRENGGGDRKGDGGLAARGEEGE